MPLTGGALRAASAQAAWGIADSFTSKSALIGHLQDIGLGFRYQDMLHIIGNVFERATAPILDPDQFRFDRVPTEYMAQLEWRRDEQFGIMGDAIYLDEFGNEERHRTVFWTDSYAAGQEYEEEWGAQVAEENRYPGLDYVGFELAQVWHKKGEAYGHPFLSEL